VIYVVTYLVQKCSVTKIWPCMKRPIGLCSLVTLVFQVKLAKWDVCVCAFLFSVICDHYTNDDYNQKAMNVHHSLRFAERCHPTSSVLATQCLLLLSVMPPHLCTAERPILKTFNHYLFIDFLFKIMALSKTTRPRYKINEYIDAHIYLTQRNITKHTPLIKLYF
jgi:hypothetical protein